MFKSKAGRKTKMTPLTLDKLEAAFKVGCPDIEACYYADIGLDTLYNYQKKHPEFSNRKMLWKKRPVLKARQVVVQALENNDIHTAKWFLERQDSDDYGEKIKVEHSGSVEITEGTHPEDELLRQELKKKLLENVQKRALERSKQMQKKQ